MGIYSSSGSRTYSAGHVYTEYSHTFKCWEMSDGSFVFTERGTKVARTEDEFQLRLGTQRQLAQMKREGQ